MKTRMAWISAALQGDLSRKAKLALQQAAKRVRSQGSKPKYPIFYDISPLVRFAFEPDSTGCLDRLIIQLRLVTLMRSRDLANLVWCLYQHEDKYYLKSTNKCGAATTHSIEGVVLTSVVQYLHRHLHVPAPHLLRHLLAPAKVLSADRIANRALSAMANCGVDTEIYKAHSLRGATATHLLRQGAPRALVQTRGGWSTMAALDKYYDRLHQFHNWPALLTSGENVGDRQSTSCLVLPAKASGAKPRACPEGESLEAEARRTRQLVDLSARGVCRPLYAKDECPACGTEMCHEAVYRCPSCSILYHVRCLATGPPCPGLLQGACLPTCFLCHMAQTSRRRAHPVHDMVDDPMGVCS